MVGIIDDEVSRIYVCTILDKGEAFGWGNNEYGQISLPNCDQQLANPTYIDMVNKLGKIRSVASGGSFCLVVNGKYSNWYHFCLLMYIRFRKW